MDTEGSPPPPVCRCGLAHQQEASEGAPAHRPKGPCAFRPRQRGKEHAGRVCVWGGGGGRPLRGGGLGKVCVPKVTQPDCPFCKFRFFPTMITLVWGGGEGVLGEHNGGGWVEDRGPRLSSLSQAFAVAACNQRRQRLSPAPPVSLPAPAAETPDIPNAEDHGKGVEGSPISLAPPPPRGLRCGRGHGQRAGGWRGGSVGQYLGATREGTTGLKLSLQHRIRRNMGLQRSTSNLPC